MLGLGPRELIFVTAIFFLLFGAKKVPELARGISETIKIIRKGFSDEEEKTDETDKIAKIDKNDEADKIA